MNCHTYNSRHRHHYSTTTTTPPPLHHHHYNHNQIKHDQGNQGDLLNLDFDFEDILDLVTF